MLKVGPEERGQTLLSFLKKNLKDYPSVKAIKRAIDAKQCRINGRVETFSTHPVKTGDNIEITLAFEKVSYSLQVLYEDEYLILYNKPPNKTSESFPNHILVHRLDKDTSGVILFAKTPKIEKLLIELFTKRLVEKHYLAICDGRVKQEKWKIDNFLGKKAAYQGGAIYGRVPQDKGKRAISYFERLKTCETASLVEVQPVTGRTHQIRVHLKENGHPVLGDWQYGRHFKCTYQAPRQMLHALKISFPHPITGEILSVKAPLLKDFLQAEKALFGS